MVGHKIDVVRVDGALRISCDEQVFIRIYLNFLNSVT